MDVVGFLFSVLYIQFIDNHKNKTNKKMGIFFKNILTLLLLYTTFTQY